MNFPTNLISLLSNTNLTGQLPDPQSEQIENIAKNLFSEYGWMFAAGVIVILVKDVMMNYF